MKSTVKKIAVLTSGGDAPGMNAALRSVVRSCAYFNTSCIGIYRGYEGLMEGDFKSLNARDVQHIIARGGTVLKSARSFAFKSPEGRRKAYEQLRKKEIDALIVIGGDGTFTGAMTFYEEYQFPIIGIPATIDNDIFGTDFTIGYDTAINTVVEAVDKIRDTASSHNRLFFVEVMGRDAGFIALNAGIGAGAEEILIPEENIGIETLIKSLNRSKEHGKSSSLVIVAEGDKTGKNVFELAAYVDEHLKDYEVKVSVLGHMQRGGVPSCFDRVLASRLGVAAVEGLLRKRKNCMVGLIHKDIQFTPLEEAIKTKQGMDKELVKVADITSF